MSDEQTPDIVRRFTAAPERYDLPATRTVEVLPLFDAEHQVRCVEMPRETVQAQETAYTREFFDLAEKSQIERYQELGILRRDETGPA